MLSDPLFKEVMQQLDQAIATKAVNEAIEVLLTAINPEDNGHLRLSSEGCLVVSLLQQWLVRYFCKKLMQLMTPEAVVLHRNKIPSSYLVNYFIYQKHFSLKELISRYCCNMKSSKW